MCLKGIFIFSWHHTLNYCVAWSCDERKDVLLMHWQKPDL